MTYRYEGQPLVDQPIRSFRRSPAIYGKSVVTSVAPYDRPRLLPHFGYRVLPAILKCGFHLPRLYPQRLGRRLMTRCGPFVALHHSARMRRAEEARGFQSVPTFALAPPGCQRSGLQQACSVGVRSWGRVAEFWPELGRGGVGIGIDSESSGEIGGRARDVHAALRKLSPYLCEVLDRSGLQCSARLRRGGCSSARTYTASVRRRECLPRPSTGPAPTRVSASRAPLRATKHDSGMQWVVDRLTCGFCIHST